MDIASNEKARVAALLERKELTGEEACTVLADSLRIRVSACAAAHPDREREAAAAPDAARKHLLEA